MKKTPFKKPSKAIEETREKIDQLKTSENEKKRMPGFFSFLKNNWNSENPENLANEQKPAGFFKRFTSIYTQYRDLKEKTSENQEVYEKISEASRFSNEYFILLMSSTIIASLGLLQNSTAVIIGAMLIAPLMMPILGFALSVIWGDRFLLFRSMLSLVAGSFIAIATASIMGALLPGIALNSEMAARIHPGFYDIIIALASGFVGAYAYANPKISNSISGVAIAVALMPPLATLGIMLGTGNLKAAFGAFLLFLINLVGISVAAILVFWQLKIHPIYNEKDEVAERAKNNLTFAAILFVFISIPLFLFMKDSYELKQNEEKIRQIIQTQLKPHASEITRLTITKRQNSYDINIRLIYPRYPEELRIKKIKNEIKTLFDMQVKTKIIVYSGVFL